jgi:uncharacterized protein
MLNHEIKKSLGHCVLIWLASIGEDGTPNVSPKEIFVVENETTLLVANIASPQSVRNIKQNPNVCVSFIDVFSQRGFKLNGTAQILEKTNPIFAERVQPLEAIANGLFVVQSIIEIQVTRVAPILAPRYKFYADTTETAQVTRAVKRYNRVLEKFKQKLDT